MGRLGSIILLGLTACASPALRSVPRVVDGQIEHGPFVSPYAYEWFIEGEMSAAKGQHGQAAMAFESAAAAPAEDDLLLARMAEEYELSGAARRADRILTMARRSYPSSARVALAEGRVLRHRGHAADALASFARAEELAPTSDDPVVETAITLLVTGHPRRASAVLLERAESSSADTSEHVRGILIDVARRTGDAEALERALSLDPHSAQSAVAHTAGALALAAGHPALAARILGEALNTTENAWLWLRALLESGERDAAAAFLIAADGRRVTGPLSLVDLFLEIGELDAALAGLDALDRSPQADLAKGRVHLARGEFIEAASVLADVPFGTASFEAARMALADCSTSQAREGAAAETLSQAPHGSLAVRKKLAEIYLLEGNLRAALRLFDPKRDLERAEVAVLFERAGRFDEAAAYYATLKSLAVDEPRLNARASAERLAAQGELHAAVSILQHWTAIAPEDLHARVRLVELLIAEERTGAAEAEARRTLEVITDPVLRAHLGQLLDTTGTARP
jgi:tetratricopeptide (TPR) repeat protein